MDHVDPNLMTEYPRLGCGAAIVRDGKILLIQRLREPEAGYWGLPGGKVDWLEPIENAVVREVREELGISLHETELLCVADQIDSVRETHWVALVYLASRFDGDPKLIEPHKHAASGWFSLAQMPEPLTAATRKALQVLSGRTVTA